MSRVDRWTFTVNNPDAWRPTWLPDVMHYMIWQLERGEKENTPHIQGYVRFKTRKHLEAARRLLSDRAHLEPARGTEAQNKTYCSKPGGSETTEHGCHDPLAGKQGRRSDLALATEMITNGSSIQCVAQEYPETFVRYHAGLDALQRQLRPPPPATRIVRSVILWGPTATGKTHRVRNLFPAIYSVRSGRGPFDGYNAEDAVLFDEFRPDDWPITDMNMYCDKWPCTLNCRYYNKTALWNYVFICANSDPDGWWPNDSYLLRDAFFRRINAIHEITSINQNIVL